MPHIQLPELPGIIAGFAYSPKTAKHMQGLAQELLRGESTLTEAERELIATYVSNGNECVFCTESHRAAAEFLYGERKDVVKAALRNLDTAPLSAKMKALLRLAAKVRQLGKAVDKSDIETAKDTGATDHEIHHTVLIAAAFCMFNRYVDGLATVVPPAEAFAPMGEMLGTEGYVREF
jgi:uncharacterized peroxidase-related enzyme